MLIFFSIFIIKGIRIQDRCKMKHFFGVLQGRYDISSQQIRQIQAYHRKTYCGFSVILHSRKRNFCHTKLQTIIIKVAFFQVLMFGSKLDTLPKTYQGGTNYIKISTKLLITSSYNGQELVFLENQIIC